MDVAQWCYKWDWDGIHLSLYINSFPAQSLWACNQILWLTMSAYHQSSSCGLYTKDVSGIRFTVIWVECLAFKYDKYD